MVALASKNQLKLFLNLHDDDDRYDEVVQNLANSVTPLIEFYLGRKLEKKASVEYFPSHYTEENSSSPIFVWVKRYPIDEELSWAVTYCETYNRELESDVTDKVFLDAEDGLIKVFAGEFAYQDNNIGLKVTYTGGYTLIDARWPYLDVPIAIATAAAMQTAFLFDVYTKGSLGMATISGDPLATQKILRSQFDSATILIPEAVTLLRPYRRNGDLLGKQD